jgi:ACS family D-galactonate transporter-like MFS transporter
VGALIAFVDRTSISSALAAPSFKDHFHLSHHLDRGWLNSAFFWSYAAVPDPDGLGGRPVRREARLYGLLHPVVRRVGADRPDDHAGALIVMRLIVGAAEAMVVPASYRWIRNNFHEGQSGTAVGLLHAGQSSARPSARPSPPG